MMEKKPKIIVIDYGMGNLRSVAKALELVNAHVHVSGNPKDIKKAQGIVLPGVGAFDVAMKNLQKAGLIDPLKEAIGSPKPFLGICLGLQLLFDYGEEGGHCQGLGILPGKVIRFNGAEMNKDAKIPHMGWNSLSVTPAGRQWDLQDGDYFS